METRRTHKTRDKDKIHTKKKTKARKGQGKDKTETPLIWLKLVEKRIKTVCTIGAARHVTAEGRPWQQSKSLPANDKRQMTTDKRQNNVYGCVYVCVYAGRDGDDRDKARQDRGMNEMGKKAKLDRC